MQFDRNIKKTLTQFVFVRVLLITALLGFNSWSILNQSSNTNTSSFVFWCIGLTYAISILNILAFRYSKNLATIGYIQLTIDVVLSTCTIYITGSAVTIFLYLLIIFGSSVIFGANSAVIFAALCGLSYSLLSSGTLAVLDPVNGTVSTQDILSVYLALVAVAVASGYLTKQLDFARNIANERARDIDKLSKENKLLLEDISEGIISLDADFIVLNANKAARQILGFNSDITGTSLDSILKEYGMDSKFDIKSTEDNEKPRELCLRHPETEAKIHISYLLRHFDSEDGSPTRHILALSDISHVRSMEEQLKLHEQMTKLFAEEQSRPWEEGSHQEQNSMIGESTVMQQVFSLVKRIAQSGASVLISGESGTGKELIARSIHTQGPRAEQPFVAINCGAIPENLIESELFGHKKGAFTGAIADNPGLFRQGNNGTVFLDEVGELPAHLQTKLLRVLQEKQVRGVGDTRDVSIDVRIIAATNRDLRKEVKLGNFREDLYYRLNVVNVILPPLRERKEDIPLLVRHFISTHCTPDTPLPRVSPEAMQCLMNHDFPGNVREMENIVERALVLGGNAILPEHLPEDVQTSKRSRNASARNIKSDFQTEIIILPISLEDELSKIERAYLEQALEQSGGIKKEAASLLGLNFRSFRYRLKKYEISDSEETS